MNGSSRVLNAVDGCDIDEMQQQSRALQVLQELNSQARSFCGTLNQARHVCHDKALQRPDRHDAEIRMQCCKRIVRHFGLCRRH